MSFTELVKASRSYRSFRADQPITEEVLRELVSLTRACPAAMNLQVLKYRLVFEPDEVSALLAKTRWAASLPQKMPPEGHEPTGFIVICHDRSIAEERPIFNIDVGIVAQTIMLGARERGFGGCMLGSAVPEVVSELLGIPSHLHPALVLGLGTPDEQVILTDAEEGTVKYYRDESNVHYVPKRTLDELMIS